MAPMKQQEEERNLVITFRQQRDERSFRKLYRRCTPGLYQLVLRLVAGDSQQAQEIVQETWVRAVEKLAAFSGRSHFRTWLSGIAINCCREHLRNRVRHRSSAKMNELQFSAAPPPASHIDSVDLEAAVAALPDGYRHVLVLHDIEGYTHAEIAGMLAIEIGTSKSQLFHARRTVRAFLQRIEETEHGQS